MNVAERTDFFVVAEPQIEEFLPNRKRVGLLGGTFNPPHMGHLIIAEQVGRQLDLDKVYFMPDAEPPHVDLKPFIPAAHRQKMVELAIEGNPLFDLETIEIKRGGKSYTIDTMTQLKAEHPEIDYYFIIGADMVAYLPKWERIEELVRLVNFVGVARPGYPKESPYPIIWVDMPTVDLSSTQLRKMVKEGRSLRYLVPDAVARYIEEEGLYLD